MYFVTVSWQFLTTGFLSNQKQKNKNRYVTIIRWKKRLIAQKLNLKQERTKINSLVRILSISTFRSSHM